jgi:hypothetical protein
LDCHPSCSRMDSFADESALDCDVADLYPVPLIPSWNRSF